MPTSSVPSGGRRCARAASTRRRSAIRVVSGRPWCSSCTRLGAADEHDDVALAEPHAQRAREAADALGVALAGDERVEQVAAQDGAVAGDALRLGGVRRGDDARQVVDVAHDRSRRSRAPPRARRRRRRRAMRSTAFHIPWPRMRTACRNESIGMPWWTRQGRRAPRVLERVVGRRVAGVDRLDERHDRVARDVVDLVAQERLAGELVLDDLLGVARDHLGRQVVRHRRQPRGDRADRLPVVGCGERAHRTS